MDREDEEMKRKFIRIHATIHVDERRDVEVVAASDIVGESILLFRFKTPRAFRGWMQATPECEHFVFYKPLRCWLCEDFITMVWIEENEQ